MYLRTPQIRCIDEFFVYMSTCAEEKCFPAAKTIMKMFQYMIAILDRSGRRRIFPNITKTDKSEHRFLFKYLKTLVSVWQTSAVQTMPVFNTRKKYLAKKSQLFP